MTQAAFDWGPPRPAETAGQKERLVTRIPTQVGSRLRRRAAEEGTSVSRLVNRILADALDVDVEFAPAEPGWPGVVEALIR
jgi:hypothetical protein